MEEKKKLNKGLLIVLIIVFFPAAIIYAIVATRKTSEGPVDLTGKSGFITRLIGAVAWCGNGIYRLIQLSTKVDATSGLMFGLPGVIVGGALIALVLLGKDKKLFSIIYLVTTLVLDVFCLISGWYGYYLIAIIVSVIGIFGGIRGIKYSAWLANKENE